MKRENYECIIIGAGPAGLTAGKVLRSLGHKVIILEKEDHPGGKLLLWNKLFPHDESASDIVDMLKKDAEGIIRTKVSLTSVRKEQDEFLLSDDKNMTYASPSLIVATGFNPFDARKKEEYGYGIYDNVITSIDLEEMFKNNSVLTTAGKVPRKVAFIHCVGSRDIKVNREHCSTACCITGIKQATEIKKRIPNVLVCNFYMDLRLYGRLYESLYKKAQLDYKVHFIRGRLSETNENPDGSLVLRYEDTLLGKPAKMTVDMVVLLVGMQLDDSLCQNNSLISDQIGSDGFFGTGKIDDSESKTIPGLLFAGTCSGPKSVKETVNEASKIAFEMHNYLNRKSTTETQVIDERFWIHNT